MRYSLILITIFCMILLIGTVSAFQFDNVKDFKKDITTSEYGQVTIKNAFGLGGDIAEYELLDNSDQCLINCYAEGTATLYEIGQLFSDLKFKDENSFTTISKSQIYIQVEESYEVEVPQYDEVCTPANKTIECNQQEIGTQKEIRYRNIWVKYNLTF